jgi:hypothetical protein
MKSLYNESYKYTPDAIELSTETFKTNCNIFQKYLRLGYSPREISQIMQSSINELELNTIAWETTDSVPNEDVEP